MPSETCVDYQSQGPYANRTNMASYNSNMWGSYDSDEEQTGKRRSSGNHSRQPSYLSAMNVVNAGEQREQSYQSAQHPQQLSMNQHNGSYPNHHKSVPDLSSSEHGHEQDPMSRQMSNAGQMTYGHQINSRKPQHMPNGQPISYGQHINNGQHNVQHASNGQVNNSRFMPNEKQTVNVQQRSNGQYMPNRHVNNGQLPHNGQIHNSRNMVNSSHVLNTGHTASNVQIPSAGRPNFAEYSQQRQTHNLANTLADHRTNDNFQSVDQRAVPAPVDTVYVKSSDVIPNNTNRGDSSFGKACVLAEDLHRNGYVSQQEVRNRVPHSNQDPRRPDSIEEARQQLKAQHLSDQKDKYGPAIAVSMYSSKQSDKTSDSLVEHSDAQKMRNEASRAISPQLHIVHNVKDLDAAHSRAVEDVKITPTKMGPAYNLKKKVQKHAPTFSTFKAKEDATNENYMENYRELPRTQKTHKQSGRTSTGSSNDRSQDDYEDWTLSNSAQYRRSQIPNTDAQNLGFVHPIAKSHNLVGSGKTKGTSDIVRHTNEVQSNTNAYGPLEPSKFGGDVTLPAAGARQNRSMTSSKSQPDALNKSCEYGADMKRSQSIENSIEKFAGIGRGPKNVPAKPVIPPKPHLSRQSTEEDFTNRLEYGQTIINGRPSILQRLTSESSGYVTASSGSSNASPVTTGPKGQNKFSYGG